MGVKIYKNVVDNIMLIITPLNSILSSSKEENVLALLKYQDSFIAYTIFESCISCVVLVWTQNFSTFQWIVNFHISLSTQAVTCLRNASL